MGPVRAAVRLDPGPGPRPLRDRIAIAAYLGKGDPFDRAILAFAEAYADQNDRDHQALRAAVEAGAVQAETGL